MGDLKQQADHLKQAIAAHKNLLPEEQHKLNALVDELHAHANNVTALPNPQLADRVQQACEKFGEKHPDLAMVLATTMQMLQNMGI